MYLNFKQSSAEFQSAGCSPLAFPSAGSPVRGTTIDIRDDLRSLIVFNLVVEGDLRLPDFILH